MTSIIRTNAIAFLSLLVAALNAQAAETSVIKLSCDGKSRELVE